MRAARHLMWMGVVSCWRVREYSIHDGWLRVVKISCACKLFVGGIGFTEGAPESLSSLRRQQGRPAQASMHTTCIMEGLLSCRRSLKSVQRRGPDVCQDGVGLGGSVSIQHSHLTCCGSTIGDCESKGLVSGECASVPATTSRRCWKAQLLPTC